MRLTSARGPAGRSRRVYEVTIKPSIESMEVAMPRRGWSPKRERQFEHIRDGLLERGASPEKADEIAARTVNKERARVGEVLGPSRMSIDDSGSRPSPRRA
jgi:hypothetical protein